MPHEYDGVEYISEDITGRTGPAEPKLSPDTAEGPASNVAY